MTTSSIHSRALLVWLTISSWSARRYDKTVTNKVNADYNASADAGRYNKFLLPGDAPAYKALISMLGSIRAEHYSNTLAWSDEGWRLLPTDNYMNYTTWFRDKRRAFNDALNSFLTEYPNLKAQAPGRLHGLYKPEDYPSISDLRQRFALNVQYSPVPSTGDIRVDLADDQITAIEANITDRVETATRAAMQDAWARLHDCVAHIADRLSDPEAIFRDSLINNAREVCDALRRLNVTDDPDLEAMRLRALRELTSHDPDVLRDTKRVRADVASKAQSIVSAMSGLYGKVVA